MSELFDEAGMPEGWTVISLAEGLVTNVQAGFACGLHNRDGEGVAHMRPMNVSEAGRIDLSNVKFVGKSEVGREERWLKAGDVLFNNTNSPELVEKTAFYNLPEPRAFSNHMTRVRCAPGILDPQYCAMILHQRWREGYFESICNNHVSQASVSRSVLLETQIALPPLPEQRRIVAKVEELLARVNAAKDRLARVPAILERFRQAVLAAACSGRLTADWRESHQSFEEDGTALQEAIPAGWVFSTIEKVCKAIVDCLHSTPQWTISGKKCLRTTNFLPGRLDLSELRFVSLETFASRIQRLEPREGDVLYSREGGILGIACMIPKGLRACLGQRMMLLRAGSSILPTYLMHFLNSPQTTDVVRELTGGTASPHLNVGDVRAFSVPLPPVPEQREIVGRVDAVLKLADMIEKRVATGTLRADRLTQAILAKAFRGEVVPTEAELAQAEGRDYEPASALLERIRDKTMEQARITTKPHRNGTSAGA